MFVVFRSLQHGADHGGAYAFVLEFDQRIARDVEIRLRDLDDLNERVVVEVILRHQNDVGVGQDLFWFGTLLRRNDGNDRAEKNKSEDFAHECH